MLMVINQKRRIV